MFATRRLGPIAVFFLAAASTGFAQAPGTIITYAGNGSLGDSGDGGQAISAAIGAPDGLLVDNAGNLYIADKVFNVVRKVDSKGIISTFAGGGGSFLSNGLAATKVMLAIGAPEDHAGMAVDKNGNIYLVDTFTEHVFKVDSSGNVTIVAGKDTTPGLGSFSGDGGSAISAGLNSPNALVFDAAGNLYISDAGNNRIRKVDTSGIITTIAGGGSSTSDGGSAKSAQLAAVSDIAVDGAGNVYIAEKENIRKVAPSGIISTVAHGFFGSCNSSPTPVSNSDVAAVGMVSDSAGNLYLADMTANCVQKIDTSGTVTTFAGGGTNPNGDGGPATDAVLPSPVDVARDSNGNVYIALSTSVVKKVIGQPTKSGTPPSFNAAGVVNGANFGTGGIVPGEIATIFGSNLTSASGINLSSTLPLPSNLQNVSVTVNGLPAPIFAVDNVDGQQQINFQVPWETITPTQVQITNNGLASPLVTVPLEVSAPAIFNYTADGKVFGAILHSDFKLVDASNPAKAGETVLIYCTGLGFMIPFPADGVAATGQTTLIAATATIGGLDAPVSFSGLAPGLVGLNQVNAQVPAGLSSGNQQVIIDMNGAKSIPVLLPVQ